MPAELATEVITNLAIQQLIDNDNYSRPFYNIALVRIGIGILLAIIVFLIAPGAVWLPIILIIGGIVSALNAMNVQLSIGI